VIGFNEWSNQTEDTLEKIMLDYRNEVIKIL